MSGQQGTTTEVKKAERTRRHIIEVAAAAFASHGFEGASLNEIVRSTGLTKGAFYFHFKSKEELALRVFRSKQAELVARIRLEAPPADNAIDRLVVLLRTRARLLRDEPAFRGFARLASELGVIYGPGSEYAASYSVATEVFAGLVRQAQEEGLVDSGTDPSDAAAFVFAVVLGTDELSLAASGGADIVDRTERLLPFLTAGLAALRRPATATPSRTRGKPRP